MTLSRKNPLLPPSAPAAKAAAEVEAAFEATFAAHWTRLCGSLYRLTGDWAEAEDLALEAFERLYRQPPPEARNLGGWLYRVGVNLGLNRLRSQRRREAYEDQGDPNEADLDPAEAYERRQERARVRAALAQMKPRDAQLLLLRHSGYAYAELAELLDLAPGSVGTLLARATAAFEQLYTHPDTP
jgi:RNA polymerase sigma-70 factor (ECF subfamily)